MRHRPAVGFAETVRRKILIRSMSVEQGVAQATGSVETVVIRPMQPVFMSADESGQIRVKVERPPTSLPLIRSATDTVEGEIFAASMPSLSVMVGWQAFQNDTGHRADARGAVTIASFKV